MKLKEKIEQILKEIPATRESDNLLILEYIKKYYPTNYGRTNYYKDSINTIVVTPQLYLHEVIDWTLLMENNICLESISRARRSLRDKYPSSKEVEKMRRDKEKEMRIEFGDNPAYNITFFSNMSDALDKLTIKK